MIYSSDRISHKSAVANACSFRCDITHTHSRTHIRTSRTHIRTYLTSQLLLMHVHSDVTLRTHTHELTYAHCHIKSQLVPLNACRAEFSEFSPAHTHTQHTHTHTHTRTRIHTHTYAHTDTYIHTHTYTYLRSCLQRGTPARGGNTHTHTYTHTPTRTHTYLRSCLQRGTPARGGKQSRRCTRTGCVVSAGSGSQNNRCCRAAPAVWCTALQCVAPWCSVLQYVELSCCMLRCGAVWGGVLHCAALCRTCALCCR